MIVHDSKPGYLRTALDVLTDDHVVPQFRRRPGSSEEALRCRAGVAGRGPGAAERAVGSALAAAVPQAAGYPFPCLSHQPGYHKRLKAAPPLLCQIMLNLATVCPWWADGLRLLDATPGAVRHFPADRRPSGLAGWTNYGYCAATPAGTGGEAVPVPDL